MFLDDVMSDNVSNAKKTRESCTPFIQIPPQVSVGADALCSGVPVFRANENTVADNAVTPSGNQLGKQKTKKVVNLQNNTYTTPPLLGPSTLRLKRTLTSQHFGSDDIVSPGSTTTRGIKEIEDLRQDFGHTMAQLKQMQAKPTQENSDHAQRAEAENTYFANCSQSVKGVT